MRLRLVKFTVVMLLLVACFIVLISLSGKLYCLINLLRVNLLKKEYRDLKINMLGPYWKKRFIRQRAQSDEGFFC